MSVPIILSGATEHGKPFTQFWTETQKLAGTTVRYCWAWMTDDVLTVDAYCPDDLLPVVFTTYQEFRAGALPAPTHTATWGFGALTFTPVPAATAEPGLFDLLDLGSETAA